jgi:hypothetical protein
MTTEYLVEVLNGRGEWVVTYQTERKPWAEMARSGCAAHHPDGIARVRVRSVHHPTVTEESSESSRTA